MMVTTGGRGTSVERSSALSNNPSSTSDSARRFLFLGLSDLRARKCSDRHLRLGLVLAAEPLLGFLLGLALGFIVVSPAIVLLALARLGGLALGALDRFAHLTDLCLLLGDL